MTDTLCPRKFATYNILVTSFTPIPNGSSPTVTVATVSPFVESMTVISLPEPFVTCNQTSVLVDGNVNGMGTNRIFSDQNILVCGDCLECVGLCINSVDCVDVFVDCYATYKIATPYRCGDFFMGLTIGSRLLFCNRLCRFVQSVVRWLCRADHCMCLMFH